MGLPAVANRFLDALNAGDVEAARACYHPDAEIWHDFDGVTQSVEATATRPNNVNVCKSSWRTLAPMHETYGGRGELGRRRAVMIKT